MKMFKTFPYKRLKNNLFRPEGFQEGDIARIKNYCGTNNWFADKSKPAKFNKNHILVDEGKLYVAWGISSGGILGINSPHFVLLRKGFFEVESDHLSYYKDKKDIYTVDVSQSFSAVAFPNYEQIIDELRHRFAYGGYFAAEYQRKGGYHIFIDGEMEDLEDDYKLYKKADGADKYCKDLKTALTAEKELKIKTREDMKELILSQDKVAIGQPVQLEFDFF